MQSRKAAAIVSSVKPAVRGIITPHLPSTYPYPCIGDLACRPIQQPDRISWFCVLVVLPHTHAVSPPRYMYQRPPHGTVVGRYCTHFTRTPQPVEKEGTRSSRPQAGRVHRDELAWSAMENLPETGVSRFQNQPYFLKRRKFQNRALMHFYLQMDIRKRQGFQISLHFFELSETVLGLQD